MQDAIIMYENGKAIGGEGHPTNASDITFDNTGTDLVSEEVESAIKEVNARTKHGIVELWKNSNIGANFAGQSITINNYDTTKYDSIIIVAGAVDETLAHVWYEIDNERLATNYTHRISSMNMSDSADVIYKTFRGVVCSTSGSQLTLTFEDGVVVTNNRGTVTTSTDNANIIPSKILGLIHND